MKLLTYIQENLAGKDKPLNLYLIYFLYLAVAIIVPPIIWRLQLPIVQATFDGSAPGTLASQSFELFGFFATVMLAATGWLKISQQPRRTLKTVVPIVLPLLVILNLLFIQVETFWSKSSDFMCYENAARAILDGSNPYDTAPPCYLYPPFLAQVLAYLYQTAIYNPLFAFKDEDKAWTVVMYFYQCGQFLQIILAYCLTSALAQNLKLKALPSSILVACLFLFNYPLVRTLTFDQVNLWILNSFLLGILLLKRYPFLAGLAVALGAHIKLYTLILLLPWGITKRWKAILGITLSFAAIAVIQTSWAHDWNLWQEFLSYFRSPEKPTNYRNNGLWSLVYNLVKIPSRILKVDSLFNIVPIVVAGLSLLLFIWFILRFVQRERIYLKLTKLFREKDENTWSNTFRFYGHSIDSIALSLLISPSVWEHHYVLIIPMSVWAIATCRPNRFWLAIVGTFLVFCMPTFEIFPLSFHRLVGLLILFYATNPESIQCFFIENKKSNYLISRNNLHHFLEDKV